MPEIEPETAQPSSFTCYDYLELIAWYIHKEWFSAADATRQKEAQKREKLPDTKCCSKTARRYSDGDGGDGAAVTATAGETYE